MEESEEPSNFTTEELIELLELEQDFTLQELEDKTSQYIEKFKDTNPELSKFFIQAKEELLKEQRENTDTETDTETDTDTQSINDIVGQDYAIYGEYGPKQENKLQNANHIHQTIPAEFAAGTVNPFYKKKFKKLIVIDSRYRDNYFKTPVNDFHIQFPEPIKNVLKMTVSNVDIINAHYTINAREGTNRVDITIKDIDGNITEHIPITIESGNLFADDLSNEINRQIQLYFAREGYNITKLFPNDQPGTSANPESHLLKCEVSATSGRSLFTLVTDLSNDDTIQDGTIINYDNSFAELELDFENPISRETNQEMPPFLTLGWIMGFRNRKYNGAKAYKSESLFNAAGKQSVFVAIDDYNRNLSDNIMIYHQDSFFSRNILARVPLSDGKFSINFNDKSDGSERTREYYGPVDVQKLRIQLYDEYGLPFDNNNMDYTLVLEFECMYQM